MLVASFLQESPEGVEKVGTSLQVKETLKKFPATVSWLTCRRSFAGLPHVAWSEGC